MFINHNLYTHKLTHKVQRIIPHNGAVTKIQRNISILYYLKCFVYKDMPSHSSWYRRLMKRIARKSGSEPVQSQSRRMT